MSAEVLYLLQEDGKGHCSGDVSAIREALDAHKWLVPEMNSSYRSVTIKQVRDIVKNTHDTFIVPVGSIEFANTLLQEKIDPNGCVRPINIPYSLQRNEWMKRKVLPLEIFSEDTFKKMPESTLIIKPALIAKLFDAFLVNEKTADYAEQLIAGNPVFVSSLIKEKILAEWRVFVWRGRIRGYRPYALDHLIVPDERTVESMVAAYTDAPPAYTLDVAVLDSGETVVIEVHNFVSCGLYGFESTELPGMLIDGWRYELTQAEQIKIKGSKRNHGWNS